MGEFGAVAVVSGHIRGLTTTMPLQAQVLYDEYDLVGAFAVASLLMLLALMTWSSKPWSRRSARGGAGPFDADARAVIKINTPGLAGRLAIVTGVLVTLAVGSMLVFGVGSLRSLAEAEALTRVELAVSPRAKA